MNKELKLIYNKIKNKDPFALIRFGDGEKNIINNIACKRKGFSFDPGDIRDRKFQAELTDSLWYKGTKNYFVGIKDKEMEKEVNGTIIDPMIFVNENYLEFLHTLVPLFNDCMLIINKKGKLNKLPFRPKHVMLIKNTFWRYVDAYIFDIGVNYHLNKQNIQIVLVAGGAWSNVLIYKLWKRNKNCIYIDIGSTLDPFIFGKKTRKYQERLNHDS